MSNFVRQSELRHFGRYPGVVVHKRDDPRVQTTLGRQVDTLIIFRVCFVLFADAPTGPTSRSYPRQPQSSPSEVSVGEHVGQAEVLVVHLAVQVQEVRHVDIRQTERISFVSRPPRAVAVVVYFNSLHLEGVSEMPVSSRTELCISVNAIDRLDMLSNQREYFLLSFGIVLLLLSYVSPEQRISLNEQGARLAVGGRIDRAFDTVCVGGVFVKGVGVLGGVSGCGFGLLGRGVGQLRGGCGGLDWGRAGLWASPELWIFHIQSPTSFEIPHPGALRFDLVVGCWMCFS